MVINNQMFRHLIPQLLKFVRFHALICIHQGVPNIYFSEFIAILLTKSVA